MAGSPAAIRLLGALAREVTRAVANPSADEVHDLRVAVRRFQQAAPKSVRSELKEMMRFAGDVRDCDITLKLVRKAAASERLISRLNRRRGAAERVLILHLQKWQHLDTAAKWRSKIAAKGPWANGGLDDAWTRVFKRGRQAEKSNKALHPLRIAMKKLRYSLELHGRAAEADQIKPYQTQLGDINDYLVARKLAAKLSAARAVIEQLREQRKKRIRAFRRYWKEHPLPPAGSEAKQKR
jgi:CHAD domain-containing protein